MVGVISDRPDQMLEQRLRRATTGCPYNVVFSETMMVCMATSTSKVELQFIDDLVC